MRKLGGFLSKSKKDKHKSEKHDKHNDKPSLKSSVDYLTYDPEVNRGLFKKRGAEELLQMLDQGGDNLNASKKVQSVGELNNQKIEPKLSQQESTVLKSRSLPANTNSVINQPPIVQSHSQLPNPPPPRGVAVNRADIKSVKLTNVSEKPESLSSSMRPLTMIQETRPLPDINDSNFDDEFDRLLDEYEDEVHKKAKLKQSLVNNPPPDQNDLYISNNNNNNNNSNNNTNNNNNNNNIVHNNNLNQLQPELLKSSQTRPMPPINRKSVTSSTPIVPTSKPLSTSMNNTPNSTVTKPSLPAKPQLNDNNNTNININNNVQTNNERSIPSGDNEIKLLKPTQVPRPNAPVRPVTMIDTKPPPPKRPTTMIEPGRPNLPTRKGSPVIANTDIHKPIHSRIPENATDLIGDISLLSNLNKNDIANDTNNNNNNINNSVNVSNVTSNVNQNANANVHTNSASHYHSAPSVPVKPKPAVLSKSVGGNANSSVSRAPSLPPKPTSSIPTRAPALSSAPKTNITVSDDLRAEFDDYINNYLSNHLGCFDEQNITYMMNSKPDIDPYLVALPSVPNTPQFQLVKSS